MVGAPTAVVVIGAADVAVGAPTSPRTLQLQHSTDATSSSGNSNRREGNSDRVMEREKGEGGEKSSSGRRTAERSQIDQQQGEGSSKRRRAAACEGRSGGARASASLPFPPLPSREFRVHPVRQSIGRFTAAHSAAECRRRDERREREAWSQQTVHAILSPLLHAYPSWPPCRWRWLVPLWVPLLARGTGLRAGRGAPYVTPGGTGTHRGQGGRTQQEEEKET
jgi:hypothetical protein